MRRGAAAAVLALLAPAPALAGELWSTGDGARVLEGDASYKTLGTGVALPRPLVDGTAELQRAVDEARALLPPGAPPLPSNLALPESGAMSAHIARVHGRLLWDGWLEVSAAWELDALVASNAAFAGGLGVSGAFAGSGEGAARRLWDFDSDLVSESGFRVSHNLDQLAVRLSAPFGDIVIGRQVLSWGTGRLWNPTDLLSPFPPTAIDREVRRGVDAVRVSVPLASTAQLEALWLPRPEAHENGGVVRGQLNAFGYDFSLSAAKYVGDVVLGGDFAGDLGPLGVHGEAAYTLGLTGLGVEGEPVTVAERALRAVVGADWRPAEKLLVGAEYYFNGFGAEKPSDYAAALRSPRVQRGEVFGAGRHYLGLVAAYQATELLSMQGIAIVNLTDPSAQLVAALDYWFAQSVIVRAGAILPLGAPPNVSSFRSLTGQDVLTNSAAWQRASSTLGLASEYGVSPMGLFAQVGVYFQ
jgi:hypothetical protein